MTTINNKYLKKIRRLKTDQQVKLICLVVKALNRQQLEGIIAICKNDNDYYIDKMTSDLVLEAIKKIYNKRGYEWIYD